MKKGPIAISIILVLLIGAGVFINKQGTDIVKSAIVTNGNEITGTEIFIGDISLDIFKGDLGFSNLALGQPKGFGDDKSFSIGKFGISLAPLTLFEDHVKIETILIDQPMLNLVIIGEKNNFSKIQNNLAAHTSGSNDSSSTKLSIADLHIKQTHLRINSDKFGIKEVTLADVHLENIGVEQDGIAPEEAVRLTLDALKPQIAKALIELGIKDKLNEELDKRIDDQLKDLPAPLADKLKSGIGSLFKKKKKKDN